MSETMIVKTNCRNRCEVQGYATGIKFLTEEVEGVTKSSLEFTVQSINEDAEEDAYITPFPVVLYANRAIQVNKFLKDKMLVDVEGRMRITTSGKLIVVGVYVVSAEPRLKKVTLPSEVSK